MGAYRTRANEWEPSCFLMVENKLLPYHLVHHHVLFLYRWCISSKDDRFIVGDTFYPPSFLSLSGSGSGSGSNSCGDCNANDSSDNNNNSNTDSNNIDKIMMMMMIIIVIIYHLTLNLLRIEFHHFSIYGVFGLITRVMSLKNWCSLCLPNLFFFVVLQ